jgi:hypothetical protein
MRSLALICACGVVAACSLTTVHEAPPMSTPGEEQPPHEVDCTTSMAAPIADVAIATTLGVATIAALVEEADIDPEGDEGPAGPPPWLSGSTLLVGVGTTALFTGSGVYGVNAVGDCRAANAPAPSAIDTALRDARTRATDVPAM